MENTTEGAPDNDLVEKVSRPELADVADIWRGLGVKEIMVLDINADEVVRLVKL